MWIFLAQVQVGQLPAITEEIDIQVTPSRENIPNLNIKRVLTSILPMPPSLPNPTTKFYHFDFEFFDSFPMQTNKSSIDIIRWLRNVISDLQKYLLEQKAYLCAVLIPIISIRVMSTFLVNFSPTALTSPTSARLTQTLIGASHF